MLQGKLWLINSLPCIFSLQSTYIVCYSYIQLCVNNIEVTVNTCICTDVFTVITTNDQSSGIYNSYGTGTRWPEIYGCNKQTSSSGYALGLGLFTAINPYNYNMSTILSFSSSQPAGGVLEGSEEMVQWATEWYSICSCVLGRELSIWDEFLRPLLLERAKVNFTVHTL